VYHDNTNMEINAGSSGAINMLTAGVSRLFLDASGNLGLGVTPVSQNGKVFHIDGGAGAADIRLTNNATGSAINNGGLLTLSGSDIYLWNLENNILSFGTNNTERARIDSSGNLGLGNTPSATSASGYRAFELGTNAGSGVTAQNGDLYINENAYVSGGAWRYAASSIASAQYNLGSGVHRWYTAASGTAGDAISFTQAMTLDASGNLGVGTTSPNTRLSVVGNHASSQSILKIQTATAYSSSGLSSLGFNDSDGTRRGVIYQDSAGFSIENQMATPLTLFTNGTERARITSGGDLLVGTTSGSFHRFLKSSASDFAVQSANTSASVPYGHVITFTAAAPNDATSMFLRCDDTGQTGRIQLLSNGGIANYSANDVNLSDRREKTNFAPAKSYLETICAIPVQTFNYIDQNLEEDPGLTLGVVAQDVQAVAPELVMESNWGSKNDPKMRLSIYQTDLQYALMKALQELKTEFDAYKASHP
jgi:hypothetical protein